MVTPSSLKRFIKNNGLVLCMMGLFGLFLIGLSIAGYLQNNQELASHDQPTQMFTEYIISHDFAEAVFENWESEFLQMGALVVATMFLYQKGAPDSRKLRGKELVDTSSRYSIIRASSWPNRGKAIKNALYANSLSLALFGLFLASFIAHVLSGTAAHNEEDLLHGEAAVPALEYLRTAQFWFESFQNWQSEFLSVGVLLLLSVYLRQRHSTESKPVSASNQQTGQ